MKESLLGITKEKIKYLGKQKNKKTNNEAESDTYSTPTSSKTNTQKNLIGRKPSSFICDMNVLSTPE